MEKIMRCLVIKLSFTILIIFFNATRLSGQTALDTLQYFDDSLLINESLYTTDWFIDWGIYFDLGENTQNFSLKSIEMLFPPTLSYLFEDYETMLVDLYVKVAENDSAPGSGVYDTLHITLRDTSIDFYPNWKSVDVTNNPLLANLSPQFWITSRLLWFACWDSIEYSGHTRTNVDHEEWWDAPDLAVRVIYEPHTPIMSDYISPKVFKISSVYPNPFNSTTNITYSVPTPGTVSAKIYNARGQMIYKLFNGYQISGFHKLEWSGEVGGDNTVSSGIYFIRINLISNQGNVSDTHKILILK